MKPTVTVLRGQTQISTTRDLYLHCSAMCGCIRAHRSASQWQESGKGHFIQVCPGVHPFSPDRTEQASNSRESIWHHVQITFSGICHLFQTSGGKLVPVGGKATIIQPTAIVVFLSPIHTLTAHYVQATVNKKLSHTHLASYVPKGYGHQQIC